MFLKLQKNNLSYKPLFPRGRMVRIRGIYNSNSYIIMWFKLILTIELPFRQKKQQNEIQIMRFEELIVHSERICKYLEAINRIRMVTASNISPMELDIIITDASKALNQDFVVVADLLRNMIIRGEIEIL